MKSAFPLNKNSKRKYAILVCVCECNQNESLSCSFDFFSQCDEVYVNETRYLKSIQCIVLNNTYHINERLVY